MITTSGEIVNLQIVMLYTFLKIILGFGTRMYYRDIHIKNRERLQHDGPTLIIANHPNTLMDAWIIAQLSDRKVYCMTKGTFFNTRIKRWFLKSLGLIPVNRSIDRKTQGVSNVESLELCCKVLEEGKTLVVFPEGNSELEHQLRALKTGAARIALEVEKRYQGKLDLKIVPIGLIYMKGDKFRSSVFGRVGTEISPLQYLELYRANESLAARNLTNDFRESLESLLLESQSREQDLLVDDIAEVLSFEPADVPGYDLEKNVEEVKRINEKLNQINAETPWKMEEIQRLVSKIRWQLGQFDIKSKQLDTRVGPGVVISQLLETVFVLVFGLPLFVFGALHNFIPFKLTQFLMPKIVRDIEYYAPIAVLLGVVLYPLTYIGFVVTLNQFIHVNFWTELVYFSLMPIGGLFAYYFLREVGNITFRWNYVFLVSSQRDKLSALRSDRSRLHYLIFG